MSSNAEIKRLRKKIVRTFREYKVEIKISDVQFISHLCRYIFTIVISPGTKFQTILDRAEDVQIILGLPFFYVFKDGISIKIAASEHDLKENGLLKILRNPTFTETGALIPYAVGYDILGNMCVVDLVELRHLLISGPTGTGKSVALKCIIMSAIVSRPVIAVNFLIFDIGANSLSQLNDLPHLSHPIIKDIATGMKVLTVLVDEMEDRLALNEGELGCKPFIVCIIDEFISMIANSTDREESKLLIDLINNLLHRGRKAKVIMILATQDPTLKNAKVDLSMIINRITFQYTHYYNSSTALGRVGAEKLPGDGALLFNCKNNVQFLQGAYITPEQIAAILDNPPTDYDDSNKFIVSESELEQRQTISDMAFFGNPPSKSNTKELANIILWAVGRGTVSANQIRKHFHIGNRADDIIVILFQLGIVNEKFANQARKVLPKRVEDLSPEAMDILLQNGISLNSPNDPKDKLSNKNGDSDIECTS